MSTGKNWTTFLQKKNIEFAFYKKSISKSTNEKYSTFSERSVSSIFTLKWNWTFAKLFAKELDNTFFYKENPFPFLFIVTMHTQYISEFKSGYVICNSFQDRYTHIYDNKNFHLQNCYVC